MRIQGAAVLTGRSGPVQNQALQRHQEAAKSGRTGSGRIPGCRPDSGEERSNRGFYGLLLKSGHFWCPGGDFRKLNPILGLDGLSLILWGFRPKSGQKWLKSGKKWSKFEGVLDQF